MQLAGVGSWQLAVGRELVDRYTEGQRERERGTHTERRLVGRSHGDEWERSVLDVSIGQLTQPLIFTQLCKVQKYLVKNSQNFDLARFKCMSRKISRDDLYQNTSQINP